MIVTENDEKHPMMWGMFMSVTLESAVFHGKELLGQLSFHHEYKRPHIETNVRHICKNWCLNKMRSLEWKQLVGKIIHGNMCL